MFYAADARPLPPHPSHLSTSLFFVLVALLHAPLPRLRGSVRIYRFAILRFMDLSASVYCTHSPRNNEDEDNNNLSDMLK